MTQAEGSPVGELSPNRSSVGLVDVVTTGGTVRGITSGGVSSFLGIPFAMTTADEGRFAAPRSHPGWSGIRTAYDYGQAAAQPDSRLDVTDPIRIAWAHLQHPRTGNATEGTPVGEDCLNLNIWCPPREPGHAAPVVVWLHGGGFHAGSTATAATAGYALARDGGVVVVSIGHRLGAFGCLRLDLIAPERFPDAGVVGQLDIIKGLQWVADNIAAFGGDPSRVTVVGQSGGGMKISALLAMPAATGLFHRAVNCSGPGGVVQSEEEGLRSAELLLRAVGGSGNLDDVVRLSHEELSAAALAASRLEAESAPPGRAQGLMMFKPGLHHVHLPTHPFGPGGSALSPPADDIAMMFGYTTHEATLFLAGTPGYGDLDDAGVVTALGRWFGDDAPSVMETYSETFGPERPPLRLARILTDATFAGGQWALATAKATGRAPVYVYHFDFAPDVLGGLLGAAHGMDVPFVFGTADRAPLTGTDPARLPIARAMLSAVATFAAEGHPGIDSWAPLRGNTLTVQRFGGAAGPAISVDVTAERLRAVSSLW